MGRNTAVVLLLTLLIVGVGTLGWWLTRPIPIGGGNGGTPVADDGRRADPLPLTAGKPGAVTGEVRILATQAPAAEIEVEVTGGGKPISATTNSLGKFIVHAPSEVELTVRVIAPEPYATLLLKGITLEADKRTSLGTLYLEKAFLVKGEVIDHEGNQVAGAEVAAYRPTLMEANLNFVDIITSLGKKRTPLEATVSGEDGSFVLSSLSPGIYRIEAKAEGFSTGFLPGAIVSPESAGHVFRIVVAPGLELNGTITSKGGAPIEGALVTTVRINQARAEELEFQPVQVVTDEQGAFHFANLRPGEAGLMVSAENYPLKIVERVDIGGGTPVNVVLGGTAAMEGKVEDAEGEGLPGAEIMVAVGRRGVVLARALSNEEGEYRMENLPSGDIQFVQVRKAGYPSWPSGTNMFAMRRGFGSLNDDDTLTKDFTLVQGAVVMGILTDSSTGRPVADAEVTLRSIGGMFGVGGGSSSITGEDGSFRLEGAGEGMHLLTVVASGYAQAGMTQESLQGMFRGGMGGEGQAPDPDGPMVQVTADQTEVRKNLTVMPGATIRGTVVDGGNNPVGGAKVTVNTGGDEMGMFGRMMGITPASVLTNADGEFQIDGAAPGGQVKLRAIAEGFVEGVSDVLTVSSGSEVTGVSIRLGTGGTLTGMVLGADGTPLTGATVRVISWTPNQGWVPTWQLQRAEGKLTDGSGAFTVEGLEPGAILVGIDAPGHQMLVEKSLAVAEGETSTGHTFTLERGLEIAGVIVDEAGEPVVANNISVNRKQEQRNVVGPQLNNRTSSGADGVFRLDRLPPGTYSIRVRQDGYATEVMEGIAAGETGIRITLKKGLKISGTVLLPDGTPAGGISVNVRDEDGQSQSDQTDSDGKFEVDGLKASTFKVTAQTRWWTAMAPGSGERPNVRETTVAGVAAGTENVQVRLLPGYALEGFVVDTDGNPIVGARVFASPTDGDQSREGQHSSTNSGADGTFRLVGLDDGGYRVNASKRDYTTTGSRMVRAGESGVQVVMKNGDSVSEDPVITLPEPR